jgi:DNA-binding NtrC family response regulator
MNRMISAAACMLAALSMAGAALGADKLLVGVALPRAQLGQGNGASADVAEPVRQALLAYLKGPMIEVVALEARIPMQINAEAQEKGCAFVLFTDVTQARKGSGLGLLKKLAPVAAAVPMMGMGGNMGAQMAASAAAQGVMQAQMQSAQEDAMANAMAAISGAQKNVVKAGDSLTLEFKLQRPGEEAPMKSDKFVGKAKANGDDVLSPLIESVATVVVETVAAK